MKKEYLILFILLSLVSIGNVINLCKNYTSLTFDYQIISTWEYAASIGQLPYKDIFYPYGILSYYRGHNIFFSILYFFLTPLLFVYFFFIFQKVFENKVLSYISLFTLFLYVLTITGFEVFNRYGTLTAFACFFSYLFYFSKNTLSSKKLFIAGVSCGLLLPLFNDLGIYSLLLFFFFLIFNKILKKSFMTRKAIYAFGKENAIFFCGFFAGISPFLIWLTMNNSLFDFLGSIRNLSDLYAYAKTPFFHGFVTKDNFFAFIALFSTIISLIYCIFYSKKIKFITYLQIGLVLVLIILEQKNIMRAIDWQISFVGLLMFFLLFSKLIEFFKNRNLGTTFSSLYFITISIFILFVLGLHPSSFYVSKQYSINDISTAIQGLKVNACQKNNEEYMYKVKNEHILVKKELQKNKGFNGKVLSFPADPIFYILFHQKPPFFPGIFDASSMQAQNKLIQYIKDEDIQYILYSYKNYSVQDEVPNYIRGKILNQYILNNYVIKKQIGSFLVLEKNVKNDFFIDKRLNLYKDFKRYLLDVDLESIPRSEGIYKQKYLPNIPIISTGSLQELNDFLANKTLNSKDILLSVTFNPISFNKKSSIVIQTKSGLATTILFDGCPKKPCIVSLSSIPLFYRNRVIDKIFSDSSNAIANISVFQMHNNSKFW